MKRGPAAGTPAASHLEKARAAWPVPLPVWIGVLARACDRHGLRTIAERVGYSAGALSQAIRNTYPGDLARMEAAARGALLAEVVECPVLGTIKANLCATTARAKPSTASPQAVRLSRACPTCPHGGGRD
jgi:hypothetical protein